MRKIRWMMLGGLLTVAATMAGNAAAQYGPGAARTLGGGSVECRSTNMRYNRCAVPWRDARIVQQLSQSACVRGRTWGVDRQGLWVDQGCSARFAAAGPHGGGWQPGPGWDRAITLRCSSQQYHYELCRVDVGARGRATLRRQTSDAACVEGRTWGWNRAGIWVNNGCAGVFRIDRRW